MRWPRTTTAGSATHTFPAQKEGSKGNPWAAEAARRRNSADSEVQYKILSYDLKYMTIHSLISSIVLLISSKMFVELRFYHFNKYKT